MLVAINDHSELRAPITEMIVADNRVAKKLQRAIEAFANDGGSNVADVHRLGNVRGTEINYIRARLFCQRYANSLIGDGRRGVLGNEVVAQLQVDKPRPGNFRRMAQIRHVEPANNLSGNVARR